MTGLIFYPHPRVFCQQSCFAFLPFVCSLAEHFKFPSRTFSSAFTTWLFGARGIVLSLSQLWARFLTKLNHFSFWLKVRHVWLFLSPDYLEAIAGLLTGLLSILLCLREQRNLKRGRGSGEWPVGGATRTQTFIDEACLLKWVWFSVPPCDYSRKSNITDYT